VIQWQLLGPKTFVAAYADGLERIGYRASPLEMMAYNLESAFRNSQAPFDVAVAVPGKSKQVKAGKPSMVKMPLAVARIWTPFIASTLLAAPRMEELGSGARDWNVPCTRRPESRHYDSRIQTPANRAQSR
jgi:hypothetical protein